MTTSQQTKPVALIPSGVSLDMLAAVGNLLDTALGGAMLSAGNGRDVAGAVQLRDDQSERQAIARLRAAARKLARTPVEPLPADDPGEGDGLTLEHVRRDEMGMAFAFASGDAQEMARVLLAAFIPALRELDAPNYVEFDAVNADSGDRYAVIVVKPGGKTPHELRREAEAETDRLRALLAERGRQFPQGWGDR